jgi:hypothetical protein
MHGPALPGWALFLLPVLVVALGSGQYLHPDGYQHFEDDAFYSLIVP